MNKLKKVIAILVVIGILGSAGIFGWQHYQKKGTDPVKVYRFDMVGMTEFWGDTRESYGPVSTDKIQTIFLTDTQTVSDILVKEGQEIKKGDLLMSYDTTLSQLELEKKGLEIQKTELDLQNGQKELQKISWMVPMSIPPAEPETEPTVPDQGWQLSGNYYPCFGWGRDGGSQQGAFITWIRPDTILSSDMLMDIGDQLQKYLDDQNKPTEPTEEPTEESSETTEDPTETTDPSETPTDESQENPTDETQENPTEATSEPPTEDATETPSESSTEQPSTEESQEAATEDTQAASEEPTETQATEMPTEAQVTEAPTEAQTEAIETEIQSAEITGQELLVMFSEMQDEEPEPSAEEPSTEPATEAPTQGEPTQEEPTQEEPTQEEPTQEEPTPDGSDPEPSGESDPTDASSDPTDPEEPTAPTEPKPKPQKDRTSTPYYTILRMTENNMSKGDIIFWMGIHVRSDGSFTFFSADNLPDYTLPEPQEEETVPYVDYFGSGYTYSEIQKMKEEQLQKIKTLEIKLKVSQAEYRIMEKELSDGNVYAEIDGKVLSVLSEEDAKLNQQPLIKLSGGGGFYIEASISELERDTMKIGQEVTVNDWDTGMTYTGEVTAIGDIPAGDKGYNGLDNPNASSYPFTVFVDETADLKSGSYVSVQYAAASSQDGIYLQKPFVRTIQDKSVVYVQGEDGLLEERTVTTGKSLWGSYTEILGGITADDMIAFPYGKNVRSGVPTEEGDLQDLYGGY